MCIVVALLLRRRLTTLEYGLSRSARRKPIAFLFLKKSLAGPYIFSVRIYIPYKTKEQQYVTSYIPPFQSKSIEENFDNLIRYYRQHTSKFLNLCQMKKLKEMFVKLCHICFGIGKPKGRSFYHKRSTKKLKKNKEGI